MPMFLDDASSFAADEPPAVAEQRADARYEGEQATMVAIFRSTLTSAPTFRSAPPLAHQLRRLADIVEDGPMLAADYFLADFMGRYGAAAALKALARAAQELKL